MVGDAVSGWPAAMSWIAPVPALLAAEPLTMMFSAAIPIHERGAECVARADGLQVALRGVSLCPEAAVKAEVSPVPGNNLLPREKT